MNRSITAFLLATILVATWVAQPAAAAPEALSVDGSVQNQRCFGGDVVRVTLAATSQSTSEPVLYSWDLNNDGTPETTPSENSGARTFMRDEALRTVTVFATNAEGDTASDTVQIFSRRCN